jgi:cellulose synthase/poly-beta-1,6-N-acetylglucosamine synthase-like glycosyltransferase
MYQWVLVALCFLAYVVVYQLAVGLLTIVIRSFKYVRLICNCIGYLRIRPKPILDNPAFTNHDATVVIPSLLDGDENSFKDTLRSILKNDPCEVILITTNAKVDKAEKIANDLSKKIKVKSVHQANKRRQMIEGLSSVSTNITIFADDDVLWPPTLMPWMLAPFEDPKMGGVGTNQRLRYQKDPPAWLDRNFWEFLGAAYLIRRNWDCAACTWWDGGLPCLSGRTVAYRTEIVSSEDFKHEFEHETWRTFQLNADDDNFLTRWMVTHGYKTWIQFHRDCEVLTTLEDNPKYVKQCFRWARSNWRSNLKSLFKEWTVWR